MFFYQSYIFFLILFLFMIIFFLYKKNQKKNKNLNKIIKENKKLEFKLIKKIEQIEYLQKFKVKNKNLNKTIVNKSEVILNLKIKIKELEVKLSDTIIFFHKKEKIIINNKNYLDIEFKNLANEILEKSESRINKYNSKNIKNIICPLNQKLELLQNQLQKNLHQESLERN
ncbi:hypothetical protein, partial [Enterobacteriaceae endosymbiont of Donacia piscatrix]|uniref:hypothetical protein n=1 Tax=Enterobacteriaceae endosymbiont of Donacia piscatrix TaxID=2675780 RepID=UPI003CD0C9DD